MMRCSAWASRRTCGPLSRIKRLHRLRLRAMATSPETVIAPEMLEVAQAIADEAAAITSPLFRAKLQIDKKSDNSPVTDADRQAELRMKEVVRSRFPDHATFGEEFGFEEGEGGTAEWMWVFDPIDGTQAFVTGKPTWGTLIALLHKGTPVLGLIDQPITRERWIGVQGRQSVLNGEPITCRPCNSLSDAYMYSTTPLMFTGASQAPYERLRDAVQSPQYGADCYAYGLLAIGFVDLVAEADLKPWDYLAVVPIIEGAGGVITDWNDRPLTWHADEDDKSITAWTGEVLAAGDRRMHAEALKVLDFTLSNPNR